MKKKRNRVVVAIVPAVAADVMGTVRGIIRIPIPMMMEINAVAEVNAGAIAIRKIKTEKNSARVPRAESNRFRPPFLFEKEMIK